MREPAFKTCRHQYWDLGWCIACGVHSNDPRYADQLRTRQQQAQAKAQERQADDDYFRSGTRYPGQ